MRTLLLLSASCFLLTACYHESVSLKNASGKTAHCEARGSGLIGATVHAPMLLDRCVEKYEAAGYVKQ